MESNREKFYRQANLKSCPSNVILPYFTPGADPERNLTRAQSKARGCGYMGVALSMCSYKYDLVDAAQLSA